MGEMEWDDPNASAINIKDLAVAADAVRGGIAEVPWEGSGIHCSGFYGQFTDRYRHVDLAL